MKRQEKQFPKNKLFPKAYKTECKACKNCGMVFDFRIVTTGKRKVGT